MEIINGQSKTEETAERDGLFESYDYPFLISALLSFVVSVSLWFLVNHDYGIFVGIWVPSILSLWVGIKLSMRKEN